MEPLYVKTRDHLYLTCRVATDRAVVALPTPDPDGFSLWMPCAFGEGRWDVGAQVMLDLATFIGNPLGVSSFNTAGAPAQCAIRTGTVWTVGRGDDDDWMLLSEPDLRLIRHDDGTITLEHAAAFPLPSVASFKLVGAKTGKVYTDPFDLRSAGGRDPQGVVHVVGRALGDDAGLFLSRAASAFWFPWGTSHDPLRTEENRRWLRARGLDGTREIAVLPNTGEWADRRLDPYAADFPARVLASVQATGAAGMRTGLVLLGDPIDTHDRHRQWVGDLCTAVRTVPHLLSHVEIMNESGNKYPVELIDDLTRLARQTLGDAVLVISSSGEDYGGDVGRLYHPGQVATMLDMHPERIEGDRGFRFSRQPYGYRDLAYAPPVGENGEPRGPASSGLPCTDPLLLTADLVMTYLCGWARYVAHSGTGVYGKDYDTPWGHRYANFWEIPSWGELLDAQGALVRSLPPELPNGTALHHANPKFSADGPDPKLPWVSPPYSGTPSSAPALYWDEAFERFQTRCYGTWLGATAYSCVLNQQTPLALEATTAQRVEVHDLLTWDVVEAFAQQPGQVNVLPLRRAATVLCTTR